jgi:hypothetical protein
MKKKSWWEGTVGSWKMKGILIICVSLTMKLGLFATIGMTVSCGSFS